MFPWIIQRHMKDWLCLLYTSKLEDKIKELQAKEKAEKEAASKKVEAEAKKAKK